MIVIAHPEESAKEGRAKKSEVPIVKSTGIIRRIDDLGRVVIPKEIRRRIGAEDGDPMEISINGNQVILEKYEVGCVFCGDHGSGVIEFKDKYACRDCLSQINNKA